MTTRRSVENALSAAAAQAPCHTSRQGQATHAAGEMMDLRRNKVWDATVAAVEPCETLSPIVRSR